jgi:hypothetical protein
MYSSITINNRPTSSLAHALGHRAAPSSLLPGTVCRKVALLPVCWESLSVDASTDKQNQTKTEVEIVALDVRFMEQKPKGDMQPRAKERSTYTAAVDERYQFTYCSPGQALLSPEGNYFLMDFRR